MGSDTYNLKNYFSQNLKFRYGYYRKSTAGHNTLTFDNDGLDNTNRGACDQEPGANGITVSTVHIFPANSQRIPSEFHSIPFLPSLSFYPGVLQYTFIAIKWIAIVNIVAPDCGVCGGGCVGHYPVCGQRHSQGRRRRGWRRRSCRQGLAGLLHRRSYGCVWPSEQQSG